MIFNFQIQPDLLQGVEALAEFFPIERGVDGITVTAEENADGLSVVATKSDIKIGYSEKAEFFYGLAHCIEKYGESFTISKKKKAKNIGIMRDCARNATMSVEGVKRLVASMALVGYNYLELYVEDVMELKKYPYLGLGRGRFTGEEIKEIDAYAQKIGVELVPCIQTLAHLGLLFRYDQFEPMHDRDDILLADEEKTYEFIDEMLAYCEENFTSRRINIGMDEAQSMFLGAYKDKHGIPQNRTEVFLRHLNRVLDICRAHGFKASMWSDMIFKAALNISDHASYQNLLGKEFDAEFVKNFPQDVTLIFWDYYHEKKEFYDEVFARHKELTSNFSFAGGAWTWMGFAPFNTWSETTFSAAIKSGMDYACEDYLITSWGDNGGECSVFAILSSLAYSADLLYGGDGSTLNGFMKGIFGYTYEEIKSLEDTNKPFAYSDEKGRGKNDLVNPTKYGLYNDPLLGLMDAHLPMEFKEGFAMRAKQMQALAARGGDFAYLFETAQSLCEVMELKATLGVELYEAYNKGDKQALAKIARELIPATLARVEKFYNVFRKQWMKDNKPYGFEITGIRLGGVMQRLKETATVVEEYLNGSLERIEELERTRLPMALYAKEGEVVAHNCYAYIASGSII